MDPLRLPAGQITSAYHMDALHRLGITGRGQTIAITGAFFSPTLRDDANRFSREFRLPRLTRRNYSEVVAPGTLRYPRDDDETQSWYIEQALDVEWAHAVAPDARLVYVGAANDAAGLDHALNTTIDNHLANIISNSWGLPESYASKSEITTENDMFKQAAAEGIGVYVASGDYGDLKDAIGRKSVGFPDSSPWVTSVGGTAIGIGDRGQSLWETGWGSTSSDWNGKAWKPDALGDFLGGSGGGREPRLRPAVVPAGRGAAGGRHVERPASAVGARHRDGRRSRYAGDLHPELLQARREADPDRLVDRRHERLCTHDRRADGARRSGRPAPPRVREPRALPAGRNPRARHRAQGREPRGAAKQPAEGRRDLTHLRSIDHDSSLTTARGWDDVTGLGSPVAEELVFGLR